MKVIADKIASTTRNAQLTRELNLSDKIIAREGYIVAGRVLNEKTTYNTLELCSGRQSRLCRGDIIAGVLGPRNALRGYSGIVPESVKPGDVLHVLNLGGVIGQCTSENPALGKPTEVEILGGVLHYPSFQHRIGRPASILGGAIQPLEQLHSSVPLIMITGTCMEAGKTRAACEIVKFLTHKGVRVAAGKLSGISLMRDILEMADFGAEQVLNFTDVGVVCTTPANVVSSAKAIVTHLSASEPDCIVLEFGDGIMGEYGVMSLLNDAELMSFSRAHVLAANDQVGAWGAAKFLEGKCPPIDIICGPVTDNDVGKRFIKEKLGLRAANAIKEPAELGEVVLKKLFPGETSESQLIN
ncbi:MAG: hypothetical protein K1X83_03990 [Oligoflexia bacterium]|nr:hypothetical protein [Oligoflexia bacterium]